MKKKNQKIWIVFFLLIVNTFFIGVLITYKHHDVPIYYDDTYIGSKYANIIEIENVDEFYAFAESVSHYNNYNGSLVVLNHDLDFSGYDDFPLLL